MSASVRSYDTAFNGGSSATLVLDKPSGTVEGDLLIIIISSDDASVSITPPSGWSTLYDEVDAGSQTASVYYLVAGASEPSTYTVTKDSERAAGIIIAVQDQGGISEYASNTGGPSSAAVCPTVTPTESDTLLLRLVSCDGGDGTNPHSQESGYTLLDTISVYSGGCCSAQHKDHVSGATGTLDVSLSASDEWTGFTVTIRGASLSVDVSDGVTVGDSASADVSDESTYYPAISDDVTVGDSAAAVMPDSLEISVSDGVTVSESVEMFFVGIDGHTAIISVVSNGWETRMLVSWSWVEPGDIHVSDEVIVGESVSVGVV